MTFVNVSLLSGAAGRKRTESNPVLFWFFVALHFVAGAGLLVYSVGGLLGWWAWKQFSPAASL
jgi:hypothetical protein